MLIKMFFIMVNVILGFGCSSNLTAPHEEDLVTKFDLGSEHVEKFKTVQNSDVKVVSEPTNSDELVKIDSQTPPKTLSKKKSDVVIKEEKASSLKETQEDADDEEDDVIGKNSNPDDYPAEFAAYDKKFRGMWDIYKPKVFLGEEMTISIKYLGLSAGMAKIKTLDPVIMGDKKAWHIKATLKSADYYKYIYQLDDSIESYISVDTFLPLKYQLIQRESSQEIDDLQLFDADKLKTFFWYRRLKRGILSKKEQSSFIPKYVQDSFSALFFARGLPLIKGTVYEFPVVTRAKIWIIKLEVVDREEVEYKNSQIMALKIKAETRFPGVLKKKGDINFWISDDERRLFLKFNAKVKIGSISGDLVDYKSPTEDNLKH